MRGNLCITFTSSSTETYVPQLAPEKTVGINLAEQASPAGQGSISTAFFKGWRGSSRIGGGAAAGRGREGGEEEQGKDNRSAGP